MLKHSDPDATSVLPGFSLLQGNDIARGMKLDFTIWRHLGQGLRAPLVGGSVTPVGVGSAAVSGAAFPHVRPVSAVAVGDPVHVGQVLFTDRSYPTVSWAAPLAGLVEAIDYGPRRHLSALVIRAHSVAR